MQQPPAARGVATSDSHRLINGCASLHYVAVAATQRDHASAGARHGMPRAMPLPRDAATNATPNAMRQAEDFDVTIQQEPLRH